MGVQQDFYSADGVNKTFPSTKHIATKQHMAVWLRQTAESAEIQLDSSGYELITNAAVLTVAPSVLTYDRIEVRVADSLNELTSSPSDISIVAGTAEEIVVVADIKPEVITVAGDSASIQTTAGDTIVINIVSGDSAAINIVAGDTTQINLIANDLAKGVGTNQPTDSAILNALTNANVASANALITSADVILTNADVVITNGDVVITNADVVLTHADVNLTNADALSTSASAAAALLSESKAASSAASIGNQVNSVITNGAIQSGSLALIGGDNASNFIQVNAGVDLTYTQGIGNTNLQETTLAHTVDLSAFAGDKAYVLKERGSNALGVATNLLSGQSRPLDDDSNPELVINGDFTTDTGWTKGTGWSISGGVASSNGTQTTTSILRGNQISTLSGAELIITFTVSNIVTGTISFGLDGDGVSDTHVEANGTHSFTVSPTNTGNFYIIGQASSTFVGSVDNISVKRVEHDGLYLNTLDKLVYNSSDIATDLVALGECNVDESGNAFNLLEYEPLQSYFNDIVVEGEASLNKNVKIVDFGTVFNNNRYVLDNPFGNENYVECECQVFVDGKWETIKSIGSTAGPSTSTVYAGVLSASTEDGIIVVTGATYVHYYPNFFGSTSVGNTVLTSAPCRVIVTKIGDATDA